MLGFKIQCKNITFRAVPGNENNIARKRRICVDLYGCEKDSPCFSALNKMEEGQGIGVLGRVRTIAIRLLIC